MFESYTLIEEAIFNGVKRHFEKLPPLASDDYKNAFYDVVSQFAGGGDSYLVIGDSYDEIIESQIHEEIKKLSSGDKIELQEFYESSFLENYLN